MLVHRRVTSSVKFPFTRLSGERHCESKVSYTRTQHDVPGAQTTCLGTITLIIAPSKLMFLKLTYFLFKEHQISAGQLIADSSLTETLCCLSICTYRYIYSLLFCYFRFLSARTYEVLAHFTISG